MFKGGHFDRSRSCATLGLEKRCAQTLPAYRAGAT
jgi:hypothetical protein